MEQLQIEKNEAEAEAELLVAQEVDGSQKVWELELEINTLKTAM